MTEKTTMEIGAYSFGDTPRNANNTLRPSHEAIRNLHEAIILADQVGLDYFGVGEHHTLDMPVWCINVLGQLLYGRG
ncbi:hypothetical protein V5R04_09380 [Jonesiaceae bacterium BS-20]|uniref:LLM class flavin-dependent oxidoreductase n=1 Tax=Jonesiaceae bacterium BS-20 TaxID=3120821 RepID=A0AAU7DTY4_9MICO